MPHISIKRLAYDDTAIKSKDSKKDIHSTHSQNDDTKKILLNYALAPIKPRASFVRITCVGYDNLIFCDIDSKQLQNITSIPLSQAHHFSHLDSSSQDSSLHSTLCDRLYQHCLNSGIFSQDAHYMLTYMRLHSGGLRIFALKENSSHCDIIVPAVFLPFGLEQNPSGIFLLDDWLMFYENGELLYDYHCIEAHGLEEALCFLEKAYGKSKPTISYLGDFGTYALDSLHTLAEFRKLDIDMKRLCFDTVLRLSSNSENMPKPLYNRARHSFLQTYSFWASIKSLACCVLVFALPFGKLIYTNHIETKQKNLKAQNAIAMKEFQHQKAQNATIPHKLLRINSTIESLYSVRLPYTPRLEILSSISAIASKNAVWIVFLSLRDSNIDSNISKPSGLEARIKDNTNPLDYQNLIQSSHTAQNTQNTNLGLDLHIYANDEWHIQSFLSELKNTPHFAFVDFEEITQQNDCFTTQVFAELF